nr:PREDICTED: E3 ubiquitin-protein ligase Midline-1-like [Latimeria chalumnae]|eukprot:XP_006013399.2 PREDICTED: E3 ubiquitin-protein ligase Midline-1-like [Latimeria chalumnae]
MQKEDTVYCTFCVEAPLLTIKSCLHCETSFCEMHLRKHNESVDHTLVEPASCLASRKCPEHKELIRYYCTDDGTLVCVTCYIVGKHKNHNVETMKEVAEKRKEELDSSCRKLCLQNKDIEQILLKRRTVTALYSEIKELLETAERGTLDAIDAEAKLIVGKISVKIKNLEKRKVDNFYKLLEMNKIKDSVVCLYKLKQMAASTRDLVDEGQESINDSEGEKATKEDLDEQTVSLVIETWLNGFVENLLAMKVAKGFTLLSESNLTFDTDTVSPFLILSIDLKTALYTKEGKQDYPENPRRFLEYAEVLCSQSFSLGRHFWEFQLCKQRYWGLGITYDRIPRRGESSLLGGESSSWALICFEKKLVVSNNNEEIDIKQEMLPQKVGMYLDYEAGPHPPNDVEVYLLSFERCVEREGWPKEQWARIIAPFLVADAQKTYFDLEPNAAADYTLLKAEILARAGVTPTVRAQRFHSWTYRNGKAPRSQMFNLIHLAHWWLQPEVNTPARIVEVIVMDRYLQVLPLAIQKWVGQGEPANAQELIALVERQVTAEELLRAPVAGTL